MKKYYYFLLFIIAIFTTQYSGAQNNAFDNPINKSIEGLSIYPNPVSLGKTYVYILSKQNLTKKIEFYNVLGKQIYVTNLTGKELDITNLNKGVYILKITEADISETRKLVIK
ncbi:MAG: T9SS type A sorting domain-containing protein [Flaviramulus sp.]|nr:T9SS type A sorting domain-containing protein [Flaviramulus sp.]NNC49073.1 T9SS type A sorting domain-containing protein [Flaviramulus sp.]